MKSGNWTSQYTINGHVASASTFSGMPAADTFLFNSPRHILLADVSGMTYVRFKVNKQGTAGVVGSKLTLRYSPVYSKTVSDYVDLGVTEVSVPVDVTNTYVMSDWIELKQEAVGCEDIFLAVVGNGGDGTVNPLFGNISVSFN